MQLPADLQCRIVAEREGDTPWWRFHLVNGGAATIESAELAEIRYEWGDQYVGGESPRVRVADVAPGDRAVLWRDDGSSEMRTDLWIRLMHHGVEIWLLFEFPRLYRQTGTTLVADPTRMPGPPGAQDNSNS
jgi:hypothetical protein